MLNKIIDKYNNLILRINHRQRYKYWKSKHKGIKHNDLKRNSGYYININPITIFHGYNPIGKIYETKMQSGKIGIYELIEYKSYNDPNDMVKYSLWNFIGYKNIIPLSKCTFKEYLSYYCGVQDVVKGIS